MEKQQLFGLTLSEISDICVEYDAKSFTSKQIATWMYKNRVFDIEQWSNLPKFFRERLNAVFPNLLHPYSSVSVSQDGTKKYLFEYSGNRRVETAVIPGTDRLTVCVSSQAGCRFGCRFCATGMSGFHGQLSAGEILNQLMAIDEHDKITNIVYMGMGEPLDNAEEVIKSIEILTAAWGCEMSASRITVSTIGIEDKLKDLIEKTRVNIAISLHSPFTEERALLMPIEKSRPIAELLKSISSYDLPRHRKFSFEYILFKGLNQSKAHAKKVGELALRYNARVNIIPFNPIPGLDLEAPSEKDVIAFQEDLTQRGVIATIRKSRGRDILAACGLLAGKK